VVVVVVVVAVVVAVVVVVAWPLFLAMDMEVNSSLLWGCFLCYSYFMYIKTPSDLGGVDDVKACVAVALFVLTSGYVTCAAYSTAARSVRVADRKVAVSLCSSAVFMGLYPAFLASYLMYKAETFG